MWPIMGAGRDCNALCLMKNIITAILSVCLFPLLQGNEPGWSFMVKLPLFEAQKGSKYQSIRIPCVLALPDNTVIAVVAGRSSVSDWAKIDMLMRRSTDGGKTWGALQVLVDGRGDVADNPVLIWDKNTKEVHFLHQINYERVYHMVSRDGGRTFSKGVNITPQLEAFEKKFKWNVIAPGPGHGIQLKNGRLVVPIWLAAGKVQTKGPNAGRARTHAPSVASVIYSDDHGKTWHCGDIVPPTVHNMNETVAVEADDGGVILVIRNAAPGLYRMTMSHSVDGATNWSEPRIHDDLYTPICFGSVLRISGKPDRSRILFCNPDSRLSPKPNVSGNGRARENLTIRLSYDEGKTWPVAKAIEPEYSSYSDLARLADGTILCLYEHGNKYVSLARFNLEWITDRKDSLK